MSTHVKLQPGDPCVLEKPAPTAGKPDRVIKYRYVVADSIIFPKRRGEKEMVPVYRPINRKGIRCKADHHDPSNVKPPRIKWIEREKLRKLPANCEALTL